MKRLLTLSIIIILAACKNDEPKDYATISGKIENAHESKTLKIFKGQAYEKVITINDDGTFKDTLKVEEGDYTIQHGREYGQMYLKNNFESSFTADYDNFIKTVTFKGDGSDFNNLSLQSFLLIDKYFNKELIEFGTEEDIDTALKDYRSDYETLKKKYANVDSIHVIMMDKNIRMTERQLNRIMETKFATRAALPKGTVSPTFVDYENFAGGKTSLKDLKGKYVYIDVWATWCGPCLKEIPSLKKLEKEFKNKNIQFVSISVDEGRGYKGDAEEAYKGWKKMVAEKELGGMQLIADKGFRSDFIQDYQISGIPRFILLDPEGNIVNADAPRPSNPDLAKLLNSLKI
ncbi:TlpA disulfide reductase family protein [uncultured Winogradskyella sp.]|uniref:TlpA family protein disulfide reductase n=1 Tax=uncultured Winogradskyella sp. TaxID=395353 RepID=UPI002624C02E|nr:TlpA disulfide reductase family protein [uncultured Winogradskyella sp.]